MSWQQEVCYAFFDFVFVRTIPTCQLAFNNLRFQEKRMKVFQDAVCASRWRCRTSGAGLHGIWIVVAWVKGGFRRGKGRETKLIPRDTSDARRV